MWIDSLVTFPDRISTPQELKNFILGVLYEKKADVYDHIANYRESIKYYSKSLKYYPDDKDKARIHVKVSALFRHTSNFNRAENEIKCALKILGNTRDEVWVTAIFEYAALISIWHGKYEYAKNLIKEGLKYCISQELLLEAYKHLGNIFYRRGVYDEALKYFSKMLELAEKMDNKFGVIFAFSNIGHIYGEIGKYREALDCYRKSHKLALKIGATREIALGYMDIGNMYYVMGELDKAVDNYTQAMNMFKKLGIKRAIGMLLSNIGGVYFRRERYRKALAYFKEYLKIAQEINYVHGIASAYMNIGNVYYSLGKTKSAREYFELARTIYKDIGESEGLIRTLINYGILELEQGKITQAIEFFKEAERIAMDLKNLRRLGQIYLYLGRMYYYLCEYDKSCEYHKKSIELLKKIGSTSLQQLANTGLLILMIEMNKLDTAKLLLKELDALLQEKPDNSMKALYLSLYAKFNLLLKSSQIEKSIKGALEFIKSKDIEPLRKAEALYILGETFIDYAPDKSIKLLEESISLAKKFHDRILEGIALSILGRVLLKIDPAKGKDYLKRANRIFKSAGALRRIVKLKNINE